MSHYFLTLLVNYVTIVFYYGLILFSYIEIEDLKMKIFQVKYLVLTL